MEKHQETPRTGWKLLFSAIKKLHLPWAWILLGLSLNLVLNHYLLDLPDTTADLMSGQLSGTALGKAISYYVMMGLLGFFAVAGQVQAQSYSVRIARQSLWKKMLGLRMSFFDRNDPAEMMSAITNDASAAVLGFVNLLLVLIPDVYYVVMALIRINEYHWILAASCFAMLPLKYIYALIMGKHFQKYSARVYARIGGLTAFLADRIHHLPLIKTYTNEEVEAENGMHVAHDLLKANMTLVHLDNIAAAVSTVMDILQKVIVVVVAVILLQQKKIDMAMWLAFFLFAQNLFSYMDTVFNMWLSAKTIQGEFHRINTIMAGEDEEDGAAAKLPETGDIQLCNVTFTYPETDVPALKNVSLTIPRGTSAAIVGLCGSGKTTTISLLERFYTPQEGQVLIGETNVADLSLSEFRRKLAYVQQGAGVFSGKLREALTYGIERQVSDEEIWAAAAKTGFEEYLRLCKDGLDSELAADGSSMSGGQSQRLVLTRELLRGGEIVLMDEPTSALDVRVSMKIQDTMDTLFADKTRILITHDLRFARRYDKIFVLSEGRLVGEGTHESLLENCETYRIMNESEEEK